MKKKTAAKQAVKILLLLLLSTAAFAEDFTNYYNSRFGFTVSYPARMGMDPAPENDDGRRFFDGEGFVLTVYGSHNLLGLDVKGAADAEKDFFDEVTYEASGKRWFVLSGYSKGAVVYKKQWVGPDFLNCLVMEYPRERIKNYDQAVATIARSFKPGELGYGHTPVQ